MVSAWQHKPWQKLESGWTGVEIRDSLHATACFVAISLSFLVYGILQERMMTVGFGPNRELFRSSLFIVFCNRLLTSCVSLLALASQPGKVQPVAPLGSYGAVSFANLVASTCQYDSLKYVSFALQTLAKCCKMLPVMAWGAIIRGKRYKAAEVATAALVVMGCATFIFSGNILSKVVEEHLSARSLMFGVTLLMMYLAFDGFASTWQDSLFSGYDMDTSNQVLYTSLCSTVISFVVLLGSQEMVEAMSFVLVHPRAMVYITAVSSVAAVIQYFVAYTIKTYGALNFATLMTARQFLSVIASCVVFKHRFTLGQWVGTIIVFVALAWNTYRKQQHRRSAAMVPPSPGSPSRIPAVHPARSDDDDDDCVAPIVVEQVLVHEGRNMPSRGHASRPTSAATAGA